MRVQDAEAKAAEERSWKCASCDTMIEDDRTKPYCRACHEYWTDWQEYENEQELRRFLENEEMERHFQKHPHG